MSPSSRAYMVSVSTRSRWGRRPCTASACVITSTDVETERWSGDGKRPNGIDVTCRLDRQYLGANGNRAAALANGMGSCIVTLGRAMHFSTFDHPFFIHSLSSGSPSLAGLRKPRQWFLTVLSRPVENRSSFFLRDNLLQLPKTILVGPLLARMGEYLCNQDDHIGTLHG